VVGLLLVFRTNTSYDRYYEARKLWADVKTRILTLAVHFYISPTARDEHDENAKLASLNLLMAYAISIKHHLRNGICVIIVLISFNLFRKGNLL
jgi:ion channel-forming bestrophin family protein